MLSFQPILLRLSVLSFFGVFFSFFLFAQQKKDYCKWVNPFVGTDGKGGTYPGASLPFGMVQPSPDTRPKDSSAYSGYKYSDELVYGFSQTHYNGGAYWGACDFLLMPTVGEPVFEPKDYVTAIDKKKEEAIPGYYSVYLPESSIKVELSATRRVAVHKYTFSRKEAEGNVLLDFNNRGVTMDSWVEMVNDTEIKGYRRIKGRSDKDNVLYFYLKFSKPFKSFQIRSNSSTISEKIRVSGTNLKVNVVFNKPGAIIAKIALSAVSTDGAYRNMEEEVPDFDFSKIAGSAHAIWNYELSKIDLSETDGKKSKLFYTALYHSLLSPNIFMDTDGQYRGVDGLVHRAVDFEYYSNFAFSDTYKTLHPLQNLIIPKHIIRSYVKTILTQQEQIGYFPSSVFGCETDVYGIGHHAIPVILDAYINGVRDFDLKKVFVAMKATVNTDTDPATCGYLSKGYVAADVSIASVAKSLEFAYDDWCVAQFAKILDEKEDYLKYSARAQYWKNLYEKQSGYIRPREGGEFIKPFLANEYTSYYDNSNARQMTFNIPHHIVDLVDQMGGGSVLETRLDTMFNIKKANTFLSGLLPLKAGVIGRYNVGNKYNMQIPYLYNLTKNPHKTIYSVHSILNHGFSDQPDGLLENEDFGKLSSWFVFNALGLCPVNPASGELYLGAPWVTKATIRTGDGYKFTIGTTNPDSSNVYLQRLVFRGEDYHKLSISTQDILDGGVLIYVTGRGLNSSFVRQLESITHEKERTILPLPYFESPARVFASSTQIKLKTAQPDARIYYTTDGTTPTENSNLYMVPFKIDVSTKVRATSFSGLYGSSLEEVAEYQKLGGNYKITFNSALNIPITPELETILIDGKTGKTDFRRGGWLGIQGENLSITLDLGKLTVVNRAILNFLQDSHHWVIFPKEVNIYVSQDGIDFQLVKTITNKISPSNYTAQIQSFVCDTKTTARYVRVVAQTFGDLPHWHRGVHNKAWMLVDELLVE